MRLIGRGRGGDFCEELCLVLVWDFFAWLCSSDGMGCLDYGEIMDMVID